MKWVKLAFHFLGGLSFAIALIASAALFVIVGTFLEARYDSHLYAAKWTYDSPLFTLLFSFFFINILFSALRRWPFKIKHIPFLITHLGLLMIIAGCIVKQKYGVQGNMILTEGSASQHISIPHTYALQVQKKDTKESYSIPIYLNKSTQTLKHAIPGVSLKLIGYAPHVKEKLETWVKGDKAYVMGYPPIPVQDFSSTNHLQLIDSHLPLSNSETTQLIAIRSNQVQTVMETLYLKNLSLLIKIDERQDKLISLQEALLAPQKFAGGIATFHLNLPFSSSKGFEKPLLLVDWQADLEIENPKIIHLQIALNGNNSLYNQMLESENSSSKPHFEIDLVREHPILLFVQDFEGEENTFVFAFDKYGRVHGETYTNSTPHSMYVYDQGYGGYSVQGSFPLHTYDRKQKETVDYTLLLNELKKAVSGNPTLTPPLRLLKTAADTLNQDFTEVFLQFLHRWHNSSQLLASSSDQMPSNVQAVLKVLEWKNKDKQTCQWICRIFENLEQPNKSNADILNQLEKKGWPFIADLHIRTSKGTPLLNALAQQIFDYSDYLPPITDDKSSDPARLLSAYFKAYEIDYASLLLLEEEKEEDFKKYAKDYSPLIIETPLTAKHKPIASLTKMEDNCPCVLIEMRNGLRKDKISLAYDSIGNGLRWPLSEGQYLVRLQPQRKEIPYKIRLHQARQINYSDSTQPYSYESDITINDKKEFSSEKTLSMNHVHETWDGYRFYLAGITSQASGLKRIQIVVNYDPTKYFLTYPGGIITSFGIILLLWMKPYSEKHSKLNSGKKKKNNFLTQS